MQRGTFRTALVSKLVLACILTSAPAAEKAPVQGRASASSSAKKRPKKAAETGAKKADAISRVIAPATDAEPTATMPPALAETPQPLPPPPPLPVPEPEVLKLVFPCQAEIRESYSLPILWDGREVGRRLFSPGQKVTALRVVAESVECSQEGQTFQLPLKIVELRNNVVAVAGTQQGKTLVSPASAAVDKEKEPLPRMEVPLPPEPPIPAFSSSALLSVRAYLEEVARFVQETKPAYRFIQYAQLRRCQPGAIREFVQIHRDGSSGDRRELEALAKLRAAVVQYDFGRWTDFEASIASASQLLGPSDSPQQ